MAGAEGTGSDPLDFLALYAGNMLAAGCYRDAACVYRLLSKQRPDHLRWVFSECYSLICGGETEEALLSFKRLKRLALSGTDAKTRALLEKHLHYAYSLNLVQHSRHDVPEDG